MAMIPVVIPKEKLTAQELAFRRKNPDIDRTRRLKFGLKRGTETTSSKSRLKKSEKDVKGNVDKKKSLNGSTPVAEILNNEKSRDALNACLNAVEQSLNNKQISTSEPSVVAIKHPTGLGKSQTLNLDMNLKTGDVCVSESNIVDLKPETSRAQKNRVVTDIKPSDSEITGLIKPLTRFKMATLSELDSLIGERLFRNESNVLKFFAKEYSCSYNTAKTYLKNKGFDYTKYIECFVLAGSIDSLRKSQESLDKQETADSAGKEIDFTIEKPVVTTVEVKPVADDLDDDLIVTYTCPLCGFSSNLREAVKNCKNSHNADIEIKSKCYNVSELGHKIPEKLLVEIDGVIHSYVFIK